MIDQSSGKETKGAPVWSKRVGDQSLAAANIDFCAGYDIAGKPPADERLARFDLMTNAAHLLMLVERQILPADHGSKAAAALLTLRERLLTGQDKLLRPSCEDIHMSIEAAVTEIAGPEAGGRIHTARSRNDQVATDMRLWMRSTVALFSQSLHALAQTVADHAESHVLTVCPGFTHGQPAMITSWGHWTASYLARLLRDLRQLSAILPDLKTCPLGAAASYGTSWPIDRERTAALLGFKYPTPSGADGIWSRGETEARFAFAMAQYLNHLAGISQDMILLSTPPRSWLRLADEHVTGSSIMPQKRNPDFAEVTRSRAAVAAGIVQSFLGIAKDNPAGYNRDSQWTKYLAFDASDNALGAAELFSSVFQRLEVRKDEMKKAVEVGFLNATDLADYLSRERKLPFRSCYKILGAAVREDDAAGILSRETLNRFLVEDGIETINEADWATLAEPDRLLLQRDQPGNPNPDRTLASIALLRSEIDEEAAKVATAEAGWNAAEESLFQELASLASRGT